MLACTIGCATSGPAVDTVTVEPRFISSASAADQLDSLTLWLGPEGQHWLIITAKRSHRLRVIDARDGADIAWVGGHGRELGRFDRPNGIFAVDDMLLVVERDNARVQVLSLPDFTPLGSFGESLLVSPYGLWLTPAADGHRVFLTDSYQDPGIVVPAEDRLDRRLREFHLRRNGDHVEATLANTFGPTVAPGALRVVESVWGDPALQRLLVAEEDLSRAGSEMGLKLFGFDGTFQDRILGVEQFGGQPEGITLWQCADGSGYWLASDQSDTQQRFLVFDRGTLSFLGAFGSDRVSNSDGIWLHQGAIEGFPFGAFYATHDDQAIAAFDWRAVASALGLAERCD
jgi:3-phytase